MEGLFMEMGPYKIAEEFGGNHGLSLVRNPHAWSNDFHMIFIDNPVGTGFSFVDEFSGLPTGQPQVAAYLENVLAQFFELFPEYGDLPFYGASSRPLRSGGDPCVCVSTCVLKG